MQKETQHLIYALIIIIIVMGGLFYVELLRSSVYKDLSNFNNKIVKGLKANEQLISKINETLPKTVHTLVKKETTQFIADQEKELQALERELDFYIDSFDSDVDKLKEDNKEQDKDIRDLDSEIDDIEPATDPADIARNSIDKAAKIFVIDTVRNLSGSGSGFIIDRNGYIVTNSQVVILCDYFFDDCDKDIVADIIYVELLDGEVYPAEVVGYDTSADVAVLKIEGKHDYLRWGNAAVLQPGETVVAIGNPVIGEDEDAIMHDFSVTTGVVNAVRYAIDGTQIIQFDAILWFGSSGGPLLNQDGRVVGMNTAGFEPTSFNIAIGSNSVEPIVDELIDVYENTAVIEE